MYMSIGQAAVFLGVAVVTLGPLTMFPPYHRFCGIVRRMPAVRIASRILMITSSKSWHRLTPFKICPTLMIGEAQDHRVETNDQPGTRYIPIPGKRWGQARRVRWRSDLRRISRLYAV